MPDPSPQQLESRILDILAANPHGLSDQELVNQMPDLNPRMELLLMSVNSLLGKVG